MQAELIAVLRQVAQDPREGFRQFDALGFGRQVLWQMMVIVSLLWVLLFGVLIGWQLEFPSPELGAETTVVSIPPFLFFGMTMIYAIARVYALFYAAPVLGGHRSMDGALTVIVLSDALWVLALLATAVLALVSVGLADVFLLLMSLVLLYCLLVFIDEMAGYGSLWTSAGALVLTTGGAFLALFVLAVLVSAIFG